MPTALITGASKGIGRAIALKLAERFDIVAVARSREELTQLAREIEAAKGRCRPVALDVTDGDAVARELADVDVDVLVNNAGIGVLKPFLELSRDEWRAMVDVNFNALYDVTRAVLPRWWRAAAAMSSSSGRSAAGVPSSARPVMRRRRPRSRPSPRASCSSCAITASRCRS
jgi:short-subunit dehydrogenase